MKMAASVLSDQVHSRARSFVDFVNRSPSPFHAVDVLTSRLTSAGYKHIKESEKWTIKPNEKYYVTKNRSMLIAFAVGGKYEPGNGFSIIGAHTDSPCPKVKPNYNKERSGYCSVGVELYGGGIWHTWFDRDLTVAGRVIVDLGGKVEQRLVHIPKPLLRIPTIAIHLNRDVNEAFKLNKENHVRPVIATKVAECLCKPTEGSGKGENKDGCPILLNLVAKEAKCEPDQIIDFELALADTQPSAIGGAFDEFIFSPRLDNLLSSYAATEALLDSVNLENDPTCRVIALFDNEEVGSLSAQGAESAFFAHVLSRIADGQLERAIGSSFVVSVDQAHAVHPNYSEKHDDCHQPSLQGGIVLKMNANQRYASNAITATVIRKAAKLADVPMQAFVVRNDIPCGSTIGPITAAGLGIATVDIGAPQLSMHSIREMCCSSSVDHLFKLIKSFFENYHEIWSQIEH